MSDIEQRKLLKLYAAKTKALNAFRGEHAEVLSELADLQQEVTDAENRLKAMVKEEADPDFAALEGFGYALVATTRRSVDGAALVALQPKVWKLAKDLKVSVPLAEAERLVAAGVISKSDLKSCIFETKAFSIKPARGE